MANGDRCGIVLSLAAVALIVPCGRCASPDDTHGRETAAVAVTAAGTAVGDAAAGTVVGDAATAVAAAAVVVVVVVVERCRGRRTRVGGRRAHRGNRTRECESDIIRGLRLGLYIIKLLPAAVQQQHTYNSYIFAR